jgi:hypothetical protein
MEFVTMSSAAIPTHQTGVNGFLRLAQVHADT